MILQNRVCKYETKIFHNYRQIVKKDFFENKNVSVTEVWKLIKRFLDAIAFLSTYLDSYSISELCKLVLNNIFAEVWKCNEVTAAAEAK